MVTPLKTWQHQEPKGLWPALGGLALLAHVGILGLSLPYVLNRMQPAGTSLAATIPIELIDVDSPAGSAASPAPPESAAPEPEPQPSASPSARPPRVQTAEPTAASPNSILTSPANPTTVEQTPQPSEEDTPQNKEEPAEAEESAGTEEPTAQTEESPETPNAGTPNEETSDEGDGDEGTVETSEETGPPTLPSEGPVLPAPGEGGEGGDRNQVAYLRLDRHDYVPKELRTIDLADTPATPIYEAVSPIDLSAQNVSCGRVDFSQRLVTYRVEVSPEGILRSASPWTGSIAPYNMSEQEKTISCLILSAGFRFTPATQEGTPVANSDLLLTIDIIESGTN